MRHIFTKAQASIKIRIKEQGLGYLICGGINTLFGYFGSIGLYYLLEGLLSTFLIIVIIKIMTITFSYLTYKMFIFKTKGNWIREYFRCYVSYGAVSILTMGMLLVLVDYLKISFWVAQLFTIIIAASFSFVAHSYYTFANRNQKEASVKRSLPVHSG
jgi:putative flippase GtrA